MNPLAEELRDRSHRIARAYLDHSRPRAILLVGSAGRGDVDAYSDIDMLLYYDEPPSEDALAAARAELGAKRFKGKAYPDEDAYGERYYLDGVQCQLGHVTVEAAEAEIRKLVVDLELNDELPKIVTGLLEGRPLHGGELVEDWRRKAAYSEPLQRAMIAHHWRFFPWWHFQERLAARDATIWRYDVLVQSAYNLVGVLAALNRLYFSKREFKRSREFLGRMEVAPGDFARRLHALFELDEREATAELERLVAETAELVAARFPDIDLSLQWADEPTPPGSRERPWTSTGGA